MAAARRPAPSKGAGAARAATKKGKPESIKYRGLTLELPEKLPGALLFDLAEMEEDGVGAALHMLESLLGREQYKRVRAQVLADEVAFDEVEGEIVELLERTLLAFGVNLGEASAS